MPNYSVSAGNPEGMDFLYSYQHEKVFTQEEFQAICEEAFCYDMEKQYKDLKCAFISSCGDGVDEYMKSKGFTPCVEVASYHLEPYWGKDSVKSEKLLAWINRKTGDENAPDYMAEK
jgi:hypothetical protein